MADIKNEAVKTIAEEIVAAINSVVEKNNKSYVNTQVANHGGSGGSGGGGSGGIDSNAVHYTLDNRSDLDKAVARTNIDAQGKHEDISVANGTFSGTLEVGSSGQLTVAGNTSVGNISVSGNANISNLYAQNGEINHGVIRYGNTQEQIFTNATGNKLTINRLIVLYAQITNAIIGNFVFEDTGDSYYKLSITVDDNGRYVLTPTQYSPTPEEIAQGYTNPNTSTGEGQKQIIDSMMSSSSMTGSNVSIVNQMFGTVTAATMNVSRLVAVKGFIGKLYTGIIESPLMIVGDDTVYDMGNATESVTEPTDPSNGDLWIDTSVDAHHHLKQYDSSATSWVDKGELSKVNSAINLSDRRIKLVVDTNNTTPTSLVLTDNAIEAIGNKINIIADEIVVTVGNDIENTSTSYLAGKIQTVARNDSQISTAIQEAGKFAWIVSSGSSSSSITLTDNMVSAVSEQINISAEKMQLHINDVDLSGNTTTVECFTDVDITESPAEPSSPSKNDLWRDTSLSTKPLKIYNGSSWSVVDEDSLIGILSRTQVNISADGIESTVKANSNLSSSLQNADKVAWIITNGSQSTSITLTQSMVDAVSEQISISASKINAVADQINFVANESLQTIINGDIEKVVRVDSDGLHVGEIDYSNEVVISSEDVSIKRGTNTYGKFAAGYVQFGSYQLRETADGGMAFVFV